MATNLTAVLTVLLAARSFAVVGNPRATVPGAYESVVLLEFPDSLCTATLIWERVLLTAAHCLAWKDSPDFRARPELVNVWAGSDFKRSGEPGRADAARLLVRGVAAAETHPRWKETFDPDSVDLGL